MNEPKRIKGEQRKSLTSARAREREREKERERERETLLYGIEKPLFDITVKYRLNHFLWDRLLSGKASNHI